MTVSVEGVDAEVGQQADFGEDLGAQEVCFVDEQDGMDVGGVVEIQDMLLDVAESWRRDDSWAARPKMTDRWV